MAGACHHRPVLLEEVLKGLNVKADGIYVDGTFGRGGHARAILQGLGPAGRLLIMDKDPEAIRAAETLAQQDDRLDIQRGSYAMLDELIESQGLTGKVDGVLLDLGVSSPQLDDPGRGFSFQQDGPLDMRMDPESGPSAAQWLARVPERELAEVIREYGEERFARRIAHAVAEARGQAPVETTGRLAEIVAAAVPTREKGKHPATRTFQAIRIFINSELEELADCLGKCVAVLAPGGRLCVISFHSLEDRLVKRFIRDQARGDRLPADFPVTHEQLQPRMRPVGRAVHAGAEEVADNPRARSAVLRVAEKLC